MWNCNWHSQIPIAFWPCMNSYAVGQKFMSEIELGRQIQKQMQQDAEAHIRSTGDFRTSAELAGLFGIGTGGTDWARQLQIWKLEQKIFSVEDEGQELFPIYVFDFNFRPHEAVGEILKILGSQYQGWRLASWFAGINSFLDDQSPKDVLASDPSWVIEAAQDALAELPLRDNSRHSGKYR